MITRCHIHTRYYDKVISPLLILHNIEKYQRKEGTEIKQDPMELLGTKAFLRHLLWIPKGRFKQLLIREGRGCKDKGGAVKKQKFSLGARVLVPPQGISKMLSLNSCTKLKPPPNGRRDEALFVPEKVTVHLSPDAIWSLGWRNVGPACTLILISNPVPGQ